MDEWMDGWMDGWIMQKKYLLDRRLDEWMDE